MLFSIQSWPFSLQLPHCQGTSQFFHALDRMKYGYLVPWMLVTMMDDDDLWSSAKEVCLLKMLGSGKECFHSGIKVVRYFTIRRNYVGYLKKLGSIKMPSQIEG